MRKPSGFTFLEMLVTTGAVGLLVVGVLPTLSHHRVTSYRNYCASNLSLSLRGLIQYAGENDGRFPTCGYGPKTSRFDVIGRGHRKRRSVANSNSRNLFLAVRGGYLTTAMLVCPETSDPPAGTGPSHKPWHDFNVSHGDNYVNRLSYSYHLQFADRDASRGGPFQAGYPIALSSDARMAILADRNPCLRNVGKKYGDGSHSTWYGVPAGRAARDANSANHGHAGQNVAFVGGQVRWTDTPTAGADDDNIYTVWRGRDRADGTLGPRSMPAGPTDSFLVP